MADEGRNETSAGRGPKSLANETNLRAIARVVDGDVTLTATQDRHADEEQPSWGLKVEGTVGGVHLSLHHLGPTLTRVLDDAIAILASLGFDMGEAIDAAAEDVKAKGADS